MLAVSPIPVGRGTAGLLLRNGIPPPPPPLSGTPAGANAGAALPSLGTKGEVLLLPSGAALGELGELDAHPHPRADGGGEESPPDVGGGACSGTGGNAGAAFTTLRVSFSPLSQPSLVER